MRTPTLTLRCLPPTSRLPGGFLAGLPGRRGPDRVAFPCWATCRAWRLDVAYMVLFHGESRYHTVDIGWRHVADRAAFSAALPSAAEPDGGKRRPIPVSCRLRVQCTSRHPVSAVHLIWDELLSGIRYVKARKRGQPLTCWRYMRGRPQRWLQLVHDELCGWPVPSPGLTTWDIKSLDAQVGETQQAEFQRRLDWCRPRARWIQLLLVHAAVRCAGAAPGRSPPRGGAARAHRSPARLHA